jgi:hypothetical protein
MNMLRWIAGLCTNRGHALTHYRRGMARANKHNHRGAIDEYTLAISNSDAPADVQAMARYNRALVHLAIGEDQKCLADLNAVLSMDGTPVNVRTMARQKLARLTARAVVAKA